MIRPHTIYEGIKASPFILSAQFTWLRRYAKHPERYPIEVRYARVRKLVKHIVKAMGVDIVANNIDYINNHEGVYLGISNHRQAFDPLYYIYLSEKPISFLAKKEAFKIPFVARVMKAIDAFSIDREDVMDQVRLFKDISERLKKGDLSYYIFAEGTRMKDPDSLSTLPYKDGSLKPAFWAEKDIIFAVHYGTDKVLKKMPKGFKKRNITFEFHQPIKYQDIKNKTTTTVMPLIEKISNDTLKRIAEQNSSRNLK